MSQLNSFVFLFVNKERGKRINIFFSLLFIIHINSKLPVSIFQIIKMTLLLTMKREILCVC